MDSSPDLSLKLRRGSSDSRDSFYMPFAQGIDSDIEEVTTVQVNPPPPPPPELEIPPPPAPLLEPSTSEGDDVDNGDNFEPYQKPYEPPYPEPYLEQYREPFRESYREPYMQEPYLEPYPEELEKVQQPNFEDFRAETSPAISPEDLQEIPMHIEQTQEVPIQYSAEALLELQKEIDKEKLLLKEPEEVTPEENVVEKETVEDLEEPKEEILEENEEEPRKKFPIEVEIVIDEAVDEVVDETVEEAFENQENEEKEREEEEMVVEVEKEKEEEQEVEQEEEEVEKEDEERQKEEISELPVSPKIEKQKSVETPRQLSSEDATETPTEPQIQMEDDADTSATITVIPTKVKTPSSSSSSISSSHNELILDNIPPSIGRVAVKPMSPPIRKQPSKEKVEKIPTPPPPLTLTPPAHIRSLNDMQTKNFDSDSIDSINAIDCKIDDDNRDTSASDSLQRTPPPLPQLSLEKSGIMEAASQQLVPSPSSPDNALVSPESTLSHHSSPAKSSRVIHYAQYVTTVDETKSPSSVRSSQQHLLQQSHRSTPSSPPPPFQSVQASMTPTTSGLSRESMGPGVPYSDTQQLIPARQTSPLQILEAPLKSSMSPSQHLAVLYQTQHHPVHPILTPTRRPSRLPDQSRFLAQQQQQQQAMAAENKITPGDAFCNTLSALYGKILVVMGIAFPMAEVISTYIPPSFYEVFYLYLYIGSMLVLLFMYFTLLWRSKSSTPVSNASTHKTPTRTVNSSSDDSGDESDQEESENSLHNKRKGSKNIVPLRRPSILASSSVASRTQHFGSFYLRMGAVVFGIGSMIYSGLELGQYFEIEKDSKCHNYLLAITPATRITFIFVQMYFIFFLNNEQINVYRHKILARFGLMHVIGTNLAVWFSVLIQETKHEILTFYDPENRTLKISHRLGNKPHVSLDPASLIPHIRIARGLKGPHNIFECRRTNILGTLVQDASPFLFPCTIEYSLICAAILYVMWRKVSRPQVEETPVRYEGLHPYKRSPHHYSVDCASAQKGLFIGILILVLTIISLILFFVLISRQEFVNLAVFEVNVCECILYVSTILAVLIGIIQVRPLQYDATRRFSLDDILLVGSQSGSFLYSTFTIIGAHLTLRHNTILVLITALASLVETACQTMFILDASRRSAATPEQIRKKPGREIVTFLLVSNLAMWAINTLEKSRAESHPIQLHFYGLWAWTIITHVSMPLAIFYRFHSTVCLCEIWKRTYKMKPAYM